MLYEYECLTCGTVFEVDQSIHDDKFSEYTCVKCESKQPVRRIISSTNFILMGNGWAKDGYNKSKKSK